MQTIGAADCREHARDFLKLARAAAPQSPQLRYLLSISRTWKSLANKIERRDWSLESRGPTVERPPLAWGPLAQKISDQN